MAQILIDNISAADKKRIDTALMKAYNCESSEAAITCFIKQTVENVEEQELRRAKEEEAEASIEGLTSIDL